MKLIGLSSYDRRLSRAARTLLASQGFDGGWGLTLSSVSSVVNTSEVLPILRAAGIGGKPVRDALAYLAGAIEEHCRPRQKGGRGENTRFVCFGLTGLLHYPEFVTQPEVAQTAAWCVDWLTEHQIGQGWPEVAGIDDVSLHQTALAVTALAQLRDALTGLGPGLNLPGGIDTTELTGRIDPLIAHGLAGLLYHRRTSGAWGWRTYVDTAPSPSKTALCSMAVVAATGQTTSGPPVNDAPLQVGGVHDDPELKRPSQIIAEAGQWLLRHHPRWETFVEDDKDVQGTAWEHMAYALGVQAVLRAGGSPYDQRLARAWKLMDSLWDPEGGLWTEPGASGRRRPTIRAAYYTVCAYEAARIRIAQMTMAGHDPNAVGGPLAATRAELREVSLVADGRQIVVSTADESVACIVSTRLFDLAVLLHHAPNGLAVAAIATALGVSPSSIPKYVQRLNAAITEAFGGTAVKLAESCLTADGNGYALAVPALGRTSGGTRSDSTG
ncbi:hypothetical protein [Actinocorallia sp. A-T 12471]|uniref:hypothetical protein n=1 Tax=Actinocorallia sp. A-T 12471 TaxID=3089813 RepID=UPI0029CDB333|nr:hypothetical protein [Actinocorallia sp. A-T 12471]MDX6744137.1 hypothetical protein [Actinocorallia sp. A-T 12471]